jgi:hypothetical protein
MYYIQCGGQNIKISKKKKKMKRSSHERIQEPELYH